jgi:hypothetical protein
MLVTAETSKYIQQYIQNITPKQGMNRLVLRGGRWRTAAGIVAQSRGLLHMS